MPTVRQKLDDALQKGVPLEDLKNRMKELGLRKEDLDLEYDVAKTLGQTRLTLPFVSQDALQSTQTPTPTPTPTQPVSKPTAPTPAPATAPYTGPTLSQGQPIEGEGFIKSAARAVIPDAFGIEEAVLGPKPVVYDRAKTQREIEKQQTIKPGEYEFDVRQVARLPGLVSGAAVETGKNVLDIAAQLPEVALRAAQLVTPFADMPESQIRKEVGAEAYRKDIAAGLTKAAKAVSPQAAEYTPEDITPKASQEAAKKYLGKDPEEEAKLYSKDIYQNMQEDVEEVLAGAIQAQFTDIIPILPSKQRKDLEGYFKEGYERGEQLPGFMSAGAAILAKTADLVGEGEYQKAARALYERPATFLMTMAPLWGKLPPGKTKTLLAKVYTSPTYAPFFTARLGAKGFARLTDAIRKQEPGTTKTQIKQRFIDPLIQRTPEETAKAERIYEESRATREKARTATERIAEDVAQQEPEVILEPTGRMTKQAITERGVETAIDERTTELTKQRAAYENRVLERELGKDWRKYAEAEKMIEEGEALLDEVNSGKQVSQAELQMADLYETSHRERLFEQNRLFEEAVSKAKAEAREKFGDVPKEPLTPELTERQKAYAAEGERPAAIAGEELVYEQPEAIKIAPDVKPETSGPLTGMDLPDYAAVETFINTILDNKELNTKQKITAFVRENLPQRLQRFGKELRPAIENTIIRIATTGEAFTNNPIVRRQISKQVMSEIQDSFRTSYPSEYGGGLTQYRFTPNIKRIVAEGAADIVEQNINVFLRDPKIFKGFAQYLVDKYSTEKNQRMRRAEVNSLIRQFASKANRESFAPIEIEGLKVDINSPELRAELSSYLGEGLKETEPLNQAIKDRVLFDVRNNTFKQAIADNLQNETAGLVRDTRGKVTGALTDVESVAADIGRVQGRQGTFPIAVSFIESGFQTFETLVAKVRETSAINADTLSKYVKASPELARYIGADTYINPLFNSSFTSIIKSFDTIGKVELGFNRVIAEAKRAFTSRNLSSAKNNFLSNVLLYSLYYGPYEAAKLVLGAPKELLRTSVRDVAENPVNPEALNSFARFTDKKPANAQEKVMFDAMRESGLIDNTNISNEVSLLNKGSMFTDVLDIGARKGVPFVGDISTAIKKINTVQDAAYTFGDNYFKFIATEAEVNIGRQALEALESSTQNNPIYVDIRLGEKLKVRIAKGTDGKLYRAYNKGEGVRWAPLTESQVTRILTKGGSRLALEKFVDYERIPGFLAWLRSAAPGGIVSLYSTWAYKMMDAPGKRGIVSHFMQNENIIGQTNSPKLTEMSTNIKAERGMNRTIASALARTQIDEEQDGDVRRMLAYNKRGLQLITYATSDLDPSTLVYRDSNAMNFMAGTEAMTRVLIGGGLLAAETLGLGFENLVGPVEGIDEVKKLDGKEQGVAAQEVRKIFSRWKAGQLVTLKDTLQIANFAGNPVFDFFDLIVSADKNPYADPKTYFTKTMQSIIFGGTTKTLMDRAFIGAVGREYIKEGGDPFTRVLFSNVYKKEGNYSYTSEEIENQKTFAREAVNMILGTSYRYSFVHKQIGNKDKGAFASWVDQHKKNLDASLVRAQNLRLKALAEAGYTEDDLAFKEAVRRFTILKTAAETEHAAFKLRVFNAIEKTGFYEKLEKSGR